MNTIVMTGATGYVGSKLACALAAAGHRLHAIVRPQSKVAHLEQSSIAMHMYDGSQASIDKVAEQVQADTLIHAAVHYAHPHKPEDMEKMLNASVRLGCQLAEAFIPRGNPAFIHTGSYWQHGETAEYDPNSFYGASKNAFEQFLTYYAHQHGLRALTLKPGIIYGENDPPYKLFGQMAKARRTREPMLMTPGEQEVCYVHMQDIIEAYRVAMRYAADMKAGTHESYFVLGERIRLRDMVERYMARVPDPVQVEWGKIPYRYGQVMKPYLGENLPGWQARIDINEGIERQLHAA